MSNYNLSRGEELFFREIENLKHDNPRMKNTIGFTASLFAGKVGVMPEGNLSEVTFTDEKELMFQLNAVPSYKKLANSILFTAQNCKETDLVSMIKFIVKSYNNGDGNITKTTSDNSTEISAQKLQENEEIENIAKLHENLSEEIMFEDNDGNLISKTISVDNIDLIDDFEDEDLTVEGMRNTGMIDVNFDTLSDNPVTKTNSRNILPLGKLEVDSEGNPVIICPFTGSTNVYQINSGTYASFETDQPFRIVFNLADLKPDFN